MPHSKIRLFLIDSQTIVREALELLLAQTKDFLVVGSTATCAQALLIAPGASPHLFIVDSGKIRLTPPEARALLATSPQARLLLLSAQSDPRSVQELLDAGATGFVSKIESTLDLVRAIRTVAGGGIAVDTGMHHQLQALQRKPRELALQKDLSEREERVLKLIVRGHTNKSAAKLLQLSEKTVETYRLRAMRKLGARHKPDLMQAAAERGWLRS